MANFSEIPWIAQHIELYRTQRPRNTRGLPQMRMGVAVGPAETFAVEVKVQLVGNQLNPNSTRNRVVTAEESWYRGEDVEYGIYKN